MKSCPNLEGCPFFNGAMSENPFSTEQIKEKYCLDNFESCARFMVSDAVGKHLVPDDLYPMENLRARKILIDEASKRKD